MLCFCRHNGRPCKHCLARKRASAYYWRHRDAINEKRRKAYADNPLPILEAIKLSRQRNPEKHRERMRIYRETNKADKLAKRRQYYRDHRPQALASAKAWRDSHPDNVWRLLIQWRNKNADRWREYYRTYVHRRTQTDPRYHLRRVVSRTISLALKKHGASKEGKGVEELLGYSVDTLRSHLEAQFSPGMSWDTYGKWHIHHIVPQCAFTFSSPHDPQFRACWALTNLQPLWIEDHHQKHRVRADKQYEQNREISV